MASPCRDRHDSDLSVSRVVGNLDRYSPRVAGKNRVGVAPRSPLNSGLADEGRLKVAR